MRVDLLILQLAVIFPPGIIWAQLDANYAAKLKRSDAEFFLRAFLFGLVTYVVELLLFAAVRRPFNMVTLTDAPTREVVSWDVLAEVLWALPIGIVLSIFWLYASRFKVITRLLQLIGATRKFGDEDVWDFTFNSNDVAVEYIHLRDFENKLVYAGWVNSFSETDRVRELVLLDVVVFDFESNELYRVPRMYLARAPSDVHIEFPYGQSEPTGRVRDGG